MKKRLLLIILIVISITSTYRLIKKYSRSDNVILYSYTTAGKSGYIDSDGNIAIPPKFDAVGGAAVSFANGPVAAAVGGKYGYIDSEGDFSIEPQFRTANDFAKYGNKFAATVSLATCADEINKSTPKPLPYCMGIIDKNGNYIVLPKYKLIYDGRNSDFVVAQRWNDLGYEIINISNNGLFILNENLEFRGGPNDGWALFSEPEGEDVLVGSDGNTRNVYIGQGNQIRVKFISAFYGGYAKVTSNNSPGMYGYINKDLSKFSGFIYEQASSFINGHAIVYQNGHNIIIDKDFRKIAAIDFSGRLSMGSVLRKIPDLDADIILWDGELRGEEISRNHDDAFWVQKGRVHQLMDFRGQEIASFDLTWARDIWGFVGGMSLVKSQSGCSYINSKGSVVMKWRDCL